MENRDRMREQGLPDQPPEKPTPGHEGDDPHVDRQRTRENEEAVRRKQPTAIAGSSG